MRIGVIRRSHDFHQQRRRASSAVNALDYSGSPRLGLASAISRRASAAITDGGHLDDGPLGGSGARAVSISGCSSRARHDGRELGRSSSQDSNSGGSGQEPDGLPSHPLATQRGESTELEVDELCTGKVLTVFGIIVGVLLLTLAFAMAVRYIYR